MKNIEELFKLIKQSDVTLIGYTFKDERKKDELISNFDYIEIERFDSSFSFKSFLRNIKLNSIFEGMAFPEYILIDINNINFNKDPHLFDRSKQVGIALQKIRENMYGDDESYFPSDPKYKLIITCALNRSFDDKSFRQPFSQVSFTGGNKPLYMADIAIILDDDKIKVIKNRFGEKVILYNSPRSVEI